MTHQTIAFAERLAGALEKLEAGMAAREAEIERLRRIADAASAALNDLDTFIAGAYIPAIGEDA